MFIAIKRCPKLYLNIIKKAKSHTFKKNKNNIKFISLKRTSLAYFAYVDDCYIPAHILVAIEENAVGIRSLHPYPIECTKVEINKF